MSGLHDFFERMRPRRFARDSRGNVAMMFGLALIPIAIGIGATVDYSIAATQRTKLQHASDDAVIAAARALQANPSLSIADQRTIVLSYLQAEVPQLNATILNYSVDANGQIILDTSALVPRGLSRISSDPSGKYMTLIGAHSAAIATTPSLEVALVLDKTGSMAESSGGMTKIAALQQAANNLLATIMTASTTKVAVVPFSMSVNVGAQYANAAWVDTLGLSSIHWQNVTRPLLPVTTSRFGLFTQTGERWGGCFEVRPGAYATSEMPPSSLVPDSLFVPIFSPDEPGDMNAGSVKVTNSSKSQTVTNSYLDDGYSTKNGVEQGTWSQIMADPAKYNIGGKSSKKSVGAGTPPNEQGPNYACDPVPMLRMTSSESDAQNEIKSLTASGNTNILEGLMWGWRAVSPNAPFADGKSYNWNASNPTRPNKKVIVLMTDGTNTWDAAGNPSGSQYSAYGYYANKRLGTVPTDGNSARAAMDAAVATACQNVKAVKDSNGNSSITVYTIGFSIPSDPIDAKGLALLQGCASTVNGQVQYYPATSSAQLITAFGLIAQSINSLRLSQ